MVRIARSEAVPVLLRLRELPQRYGLNAAFAFDLGLLCLVFRLVRRKRGSGGSADILAAVVPMAPEAQARTGRVRCYRNCYPTW
jgi:hypothetical protein